MKIDENILIDYIKGTLDPSLQKDVEEWIKASDDNMMDFIYIKNIYVKETMPDREASEEEMKRMRTYVEKQKLASRKKRLIIPYAAAAVLLIALILNITFGWLGPNAATGSKSITIDERATAKGLLNYSSDTNNINVLYTEKGIKAQITLPDGTKVWLNSDSKISYPNKFSHGIREVSLSGEGYFDVAKDSLRPMIITTLKNFKIEVVGTSFNLRAYKDDKEAETTLYEGKINILSNSTSEKEIIAALHPNESFIIKDDKETTLDEKPNMSNLSAWKEGVLVLDNIPLSEAIQKIERWHGIKIEVENNAALNRNVTAAFKSESVIQIFELLQMSDVLKYRTDDKKIVIY